MRCLVVISKETGLDITDVRFLTATNSVFHETTKHYVTIFMTAIARSAENGLELVPKVMEPDKCEGWSWSTFSDMRKMTAATGAELFKPLYSLMEQRMELCKSLESASGPRDVERTSICTPHAGILENSNVHGAIAKARACHI
ncbi:hypothetical protein KC342_g80 [Hortaea werneckii]|nr:hypothetical protein KC342_g80 [Hortaea werneckii]